MKCPECKGEGGWYESYGSAGTWKEDCFFCHAKGKVSIWWMVRTLFWEHIPVSFIEWWDKCKDKCKGEPCKHS